MATSVSPESGSPSQQQLADYYSESLAEISRRSSQANAGNRMMVRQREQTLTKLLGPGDISTATLIEVGAGNGNVLAAWEQRGASASRMLGVDLLHFRLTEAADLHPQFSYVCASGHRLPLPDGTVDLVVAYTLFSSILDRELAAAVAREMDRVLRPGGRAVIYDFRVSKPGNQGTRGITRREVRDLFPGYSERSALVTVLPPLARALGPIAEPLYPVLSRLRPLLTHRLSVMTKSSAEADVPPGGGRRVLHASSVHPITDNRIFHKECKALAAAGYDVHLAAIGPPSPEQASLAVQLHPLPEVGSRLLRPLLGYWRIWRLLRDLRPDLFHVHDPELIPLAVLWRMRSRSAAIYDAHEQLAASVRDKDYLPRSVRGAVGAFARLLELAAGRKLSAVVAATPAIARAYPRRKVVLVQNFPWLGDFGPPTSIDKAAPRNFCYVGGWWVDRCPEEITQALALPGSTGPLTLTVAGPLSPELEQALASGRWPEVTYLGRLPVSRVPEVIANSIAGLVLFRPMANHYESQPTKLFEYMAAGRPFIASDFPHWRALVGEFDCGLFVDPTDPVAIRAAMDRLVSDKELACAMGARGRAALAGRFTFESQADVLVGRVRELAK